MKALLLLLLPFTAPAASVPEVVSAYTARVSQDYGDTVAAAEALRASIGRFLDAPTAASLSEAKAAWMHARSFYGPTEAYRFYGGPIDAEDGPEGLLNAWPLDEAYIDYVIGRKEGGIVNDTAAYPQITEALLTDLNEKEGEKNIATGYHAIEFLLWGQDLNPEGPGRRPVSDYVVGLGVNADRRREYLAAAASLLVKHLISVRDQWEPGASYRLAFEADGEGSLAKILLGAYRLAGDELAHERMFVAYDTQQQEDEQSCFSDTTHLDIIQNFQGIARVLDGPLALVEAANAEQAGALRAALARAGAGVRAIPAPFDRAIYSEEGRAAILGAVTALEELAKEIQAAGAAIGVKVE